jgi:hypothetical protein
VATGGYAAWLPQVAEERDSTTGSAGRCHVLPGHRRRPFCGHRLKDLTILDHTDWDDVPEERRCPTCAEALAAIEAEEAETRARAVADRLEIIDGLLKAFDHLPEVGEAVWTAADQEEALARLTGPPLSLTEMQAIPVLSWPFYRQTRAGRHHLEAQRAELLDGLDRPAVRAGTILKSEPVLLLVDDTVAEDALRWRDRAVEAFLCLPGEPGADDESALRVALGLTSAPEEPLRYGQVCVVAPPSSALRHWVRQYFADHDALSGVELFQCVPPYNRLSARPVAADQP